MPEIGPVRLYPANSDGQIEYTDRVTHWMIMQVYPSPPLVMMYYTLIPIPIYVEDPTNRAVTRCHFENGFRTLQWMIDHRELP